MPSSGNGASKSRPDAVRSLAVRYLPLAEITPYARNARTHSAVQIDKLRASLRQFGWTNPVLVAGRELIAGHARVMAASAMAEAGDPIAGNADPRSVPTVDLSHLSAAQRRAYIIADNRLAEDAGWDNALLRMEFGDLEDIGFDLSLTGFALDQVTDIMKGSSATAPEEFRSYDEDIETDHECPRCHYVFSGGRTVPKAAE